MPILEYDSLFDETKCLEDVLAPDFLDDLADRLGNDWCRTEVPFTSQQNWRVASQQQPLRNEYIELEDSPRLRVIIRLEFK